MKTVILVGAGASLAEALPQRPARDRLPPLDATFFDLCRVAKLDGRERVQSYMKRSFGIDPFNGRYRMEEVFNFIYSDAFSDDASDECLQAYWALIRMYAAAIARTTNGLIGSSRYGVGALLRFLLRQDPAAEYTFVTFNQDLVIENSIEETVRMARYGGAPWNLREAYGVAFSDFLRLRAGSGGFSTTAGGPSIRVLKLHGSLNWFYNVRSGVDPKNSIRSPTGALHCLTNRRILSGLQYRGPNRSVDILPLVVPPIYEKASRYQAVVGAVWALARSAFEAADRMVIFGYSFPDADVAARSLLRAAFHRNHSLNEISVIDVSSGVVAGISDLLEADCTHHYRSVRGFCGTG